MLRSSELIGGPGLVPTLVRWERVLLGLPVNSFYISTCTSRALCAHFLERAPAPAPNHKKERRSCSRSSNKNERALAPAPEKLECAHFALLHFLCAKMC